MFGAATREKSKQLGRVPYTSSFHLRMVLVQKKICPPIMMCEGHRKPPNRTPGRCRVPTPRQGFHQEMLRKLALHLAAQPEEVPDTVATAPSPETMVKDSRLDGLDRPSYL